MASSNTGKRKQHGSVKRSAANYCLVSASMHGRGLLAAAEIERGTVIVLLKGESISYRQVCAMPNPDLAFQIGPDEYLDLIGPAVYGNHSCSPNSGVTDDLRLIALRRIKAGEEICYDYSTTMDIETECAFVCCCGSKWCRKKIGGFNTLSAPRRRRYLAAGVVQRFLLNEQR